MYSRFVLGLFLLTTFCSYNKSVAQEKEKEKTTFYISPSLGFIPHGLNSLQGFSLGMIKPVTKDWDGYFEMMGMTTFSSDVGDAFEFDDWHQSTYWGLEIGGMRYFTPERFDSERRWQWTFGLMFRSGSEELVLNQQGGSVPNSGDLQTRSYVSNGSVFYTKRKRLNDVGISVGSAYEFPWWDGLETFGGGRVYLTPSGQHFFRFTFQVFYDL